MWSDFVLQRVSREEHVPSFLQWLSEHGVDTSAVAVEQFADAGYGLKATRDINVSITMCLVCCIYTGQFPTYRYFCNFTPLLPERLRSIVMRVFVCPSVCSFRYLRNHITKLRQFFVHVDWSWLSLSLVALQYVM